MPTSLEHSTKYKYRKINKDRYNLEIRMNGTKHDIPNTNCLGAREEEERRYKRVHNQRERLNS